VRGDRPGHNLSSVVVAHAEGHPVEDTVYQQGGYSRGARGADAPRKPVRPEREGKAEDQRGDGDPPGLGQPKRDHLRDHEACEHDLGHARAERLEGGAPRQEVREHGRRGEGERADEEGGLEHAAA
jgi:hypothetical protein